jgi:anthranilate phosphoribosyltransferase
MALHCTGKYANYESAYLTAVESLERGKAFESLTKLIAIQP